MNLKIRTALLISSWFFLDLLPNSEEDDYDTDKKKKSKESSKKQQKEKSKGKSFPFKILSDYKMMASRSKYDWFGGLEEDLSSTKKNRFSPR